MRDLTTIYQVNVVLINQPFESKKCMHIFFVVVLNNYKILKKINLGFLYCFHFNRHLRLIKGHYAYSNDAILDNPHHSISVCK